MFFEVINCLFFFLNGTRPVFSGLEIWCVEKQLRLVPVPKSLHGKFYSGNSYVVLSVSCCFSHFTVNIEIPFFLDNIELRFLFVLCDRRFCQEAALLSTTYITGWEKMQMRSFFLILPSYLSYLGFSRPALIWEPLNFELPAYIIKIK
jgi:hypothetical protein